MTTGGWVPGHDDEVELNEDIEDDDNIPRLELRLGEIGLASAPADDVDTDGHGQVEHGLRENGQIVDFFGRQQRKLTTRLTLRRELTESKSISSRDGQNHQGRQRPNDKIWPQGSSERLGRNPEGSPGKNTLPATLTNPPRQTNDYRNHVTERGQSNEKVEAAYGATVSEDGGEEQTGSGKARVLKIILGDCKCVSG